MYNTVAMLMSTILAVWGGQEGGWGSCALVVNGTGGKPVTPYRDGC
jgi:hypothetical protein